MTTIQLTWLSCVAKWHWWLSRIRWTQINWLLWLDMRSKYGRKLSKKFNLGSLRREIMLRTHLMNLWRSLRLAKRILKTMLKWVMMKANKWICCSVYRWRFLWWICWHLSSKNTLLVKFRTLQAHWMWSLTTSWRFVSTRTPQPSLRLSLSSIICISHFCWEWQAVKLIPNKLTPQSLSSMCNHRPSWLT